MRVIAGSARGKRLFSPKSGKIRPVLDQVKEAIFNILWEIEGRRLLDLFAGTGAIGIEALSRGAAHVTFVDQEKEAVQLIRKNLEHCGFTEQGRVLPMTSGAAIAKLEREGATFDLIFVDPPYQQRLIQKTFQKLASSLIVTPATRFVVEHHPKEPIPDIPGLALTDQRKYGQTRISFLKRI